MLKHVSAAACWSDSMARCTFPALTWQGCAPTWSIILLTIEGWLYSPPPGSALGNMTAWLIRVAIEQDSA
jgi:hypothetical protein